MGVLDSIQAAYERGKTLDQILKMVRPSASEQPLDAETLSAIVEIARNGPLAVQEIVRRGMPCFLRKPRGLDIFAACGQLKLIQPVLA